MNLFHGGILAFHDLGDCPSIRVETMHAAPLYGLTVSAIRFSGIVDRRLY